MANGIFLGGFAQGQRSASRLDLAQQSNDMQKAELERRQQNDIESQRRTAIVNTAKLAADTLNAYREAGQAPPPDLVNGFVAELQSLGASDGDVNAMVQAIQARAALPPAQQPDPVADARTKGVAAAEQKIAEQGRLQEAGLGGDKPDVTTKQKNDFAKISAAAAALESALGRFERFVEREGAVMNPVTGEATELQGLRRSIQLQLKELFNLGVLNGPDLALMNEMLFNPQLSVGLDGVNIPANPRERAAASVRQIRETIAEIVNAQRRTMGLPVQGRAAPEITIDANGNIVQ